MIKTDKPLVQWDLNRVVEITTDETFNEVHFYNSNCPKALVVKPFDNNTKANIPNILLQEALPIVVWLVHSDESGDRSLDCDTLVVSPRKMPDDYVYEETEVITFKKLTKDVKEAVKRANDISADLEEKRDSGYFNGYTPQRGVDYFNSEDLELAEKYIADKVEPLQEQIDNCIAGLKGFYYKAVDKNNKIIYLTKERLCTDGNYYIECLGNFAFWKVTTPDGGERGIYGEGYKGGTAFVSENSKYRISQKVEVEPEHSYQMNVFINLQENVTSNEMKAYLIVRSYTADNEFIENNFTTFQKKLKNVTIIDTDTNETVTTMESGKWYQFSTIINTGANVGYLELEMYSTTERAYFDNISLYSTLQNKDINLVTNGGFEGTPQIETDLYYSENAVGKLLSVCNSAKFENSLITTKVEPGKIYYELVDESIDPFATATKKEEVDIDDFSVWCDYCHDEGAIQLREKGTAIVVISSTEGSNKRFKITVDDSGTLSAAEIV